MYIMDTIILSEGNYDFNNAKFIIKRDLSEMSSYSSKQNNENRVNNKDSKNRNQKDKDNVKTPKDSTKYRGGYLRKIMNYSDGQ